MNSKVKRKEARAKSYLISFFYVGFATLSLLSMYPDDFLYGGWVTWAILLTLPVNFIGLGVLYADPEQHAIVFLIQLFVFIVTGWLTFRVFFKRRILKS